MPKVAPRGSRTSGGTSHAIHAIHARATRPARAATRPIEGPAGHALDPRHARSARPGSASWLQRESGRRGGSVRRPGACVFAAPDDLPELRESREGCPWPRPRGSALGLARGLLGRGLRRALLRLGAIGLPLRPILLDQALRDVLVLGADHPEHRRRAVLTSWNRAVLDGRLLARTTRRSTGPSRDDCSRTSGATPRGLAAANRRKDRVASAREDLTLYRASQTIDKIRNKCGNGSGPVLRHLLIPPLCGRAG